MDASDQKKVTPAFHTGCIFWVGARWDGVWAEGGVGCGRWRRGWGVGLAKRKNHPTGSKGDGSD